jgi:iron complex outermembrane receptor protein
MNQFSMANVRSYGPGLAQTVSLQGFSGSQISVLWEDVPLNNPMLGLTDLSLYPSVMIDFVDVNAHQGSAEYGSHAIGGVIQLRQRRAEQSGLTVLFQGNTLQSRSAQARVQQNLGKWYIDMGGVYQRAPNRFTYDDIMQNPVVQRRRQNAQKELTSGVFSLSYNGSRFQNDFRVWATNVESGIPGSIVGPSPNATQADNMFRLSNRLSYLLLDYMLLTTSGMYSRHQLDFRDPDTNITSLSTSNTLSARAAIRIKSSEQKQIRIQTGYSHSSITFTEYEAPNRQHVFMQANGYVELIETHFHPSVRFDSYNQFGRAITAGLGIVRSVDFYESRIYANINRNFAPPTFNDLYWPALGNLELEPETSIKLDLGVELIVRGVRVHIQVFDNIIQNGIQWLPSQADGRFRPDNIRSVRSRGISTGAMHRFSTWAVQHALSAEHTLLDARYATERFVGDQASGNQLVYQPRYRSFISLYSTSRFVNFSASWNYTGSRSITEDNSIRLPSSQLSSAGLSRSIDLAAIEFVISVHVENLFDADVEQIRFYPMPGRHYHFNLKINL